MIRRNLCCSVNAQKVHGCEPIPWLLLPRGPGVGAKARVFLVGHLFDGLAIIPRLHEKICEHPDFLGKPAREVCAQQREGLELDLSPESRTLDLGFWTSSHNDVNPNLFWSSLCCALKSSSAAAGVGLKCPSSLEAVARNDRAS